jgi:hypothetical protein
MYAELCGSLITTSGEYRAQLQLHVLLLLQLGHLTTCSHPPIMTSSTFPSPDTSNHTYTRHKAATPPGPAGLLLLHLSMNNCSTPDVVRNLHVTWTWKMATVPCLAGAIHSCIDIIAVDVLNV